MKKVIQLELTVDETTYLIYTLIYTGILVTASSEGEIKIETERAIKILSNLYRKVTGDRLFSLVACLKAYRNSINKK